MRCCPNSAIQGFFRISRYGAITPVCSSGGGFDLLAFCVETICEGGAVFSCILPWLGF